MPNESVTDEGDNPTQPIKGDAIKIDKYSERKEDSRLIEVYKSLDNKIWVSVVRNYNQSDISAMGLTNEIKRLAYAPLEYQWNNPLPTHYIDNHIAVSTQLTEADRKSSLPTYRVPDKYITAIGYPEKNMSLLVMSNGINVTWDIQKEMVDRFKL